MEYRLDNGTLQSSPSFAGIANGSHSITVRNSAGCTNTGNSFTVFCACINGPTVTLGSTSESVCGTSTPVTVTGNTFGGSSTAVTLSTNGAGSVTPSSANTSPFSFTYTPSAADVNRTVTVTVTTNNPLGTPCEARSAVFTLRVNGIPTAPVIGNITHPTCLVASGSVVLNGLPSSGTWTINRSPGNVTTSGSGSSRTITGLEPGTYTFTVTTASECTSVSSGNVVINPQPGAFPAPVPGTVTHPTCNLSTGSVAISGLPTGTWTLIRNPGGVTITGTGATRTVGGIPAGTYNFTVINSAGCSSLTSSDVVINEQPVTPTAPSVGIRTQPTCSVPTGGVVLNGLPETGTWTLTRLPGTIQITGTGVSSTVSDLIPGIYNFTVTNSVGCVSVASGNVIIAAQPPTPTAHDLHYQATLRLLYGLQL
jgi:hypothetical protein